MREQLQRRGCAPASAPTSPSAPAEAGSVGFLGAAAEEAEGEEVEINMAPGVEVFEAFRQARSTNGRQAVQTVLANHVPKRLAQQRTEAVAR